MELSLMGDWCRAVFVWNNPNKVWLKWGRHVEICLEKRLEINHLILLWKESYCLLQLPYKIVYKQLLQLRAWKFSFQLLERLKFNPSFPHTNVHVQNIALLWVLQPFKIFSIIFSQANLVAGQTTWPLQSPWHTSHFGPNRTWAHSSSRSVAHSAFWISQPQEPHPVAWSWIYD